jgi:hypothetical protein
MISLALAACLWMPSFPAAIDGPVCTPTNETVECRCSECFTWDGSAAVVTRYDIFRSGGGSGSLTYVGKVQETVVTDPYGVVSRYNPPPIWCFARDSVMPLQGLLYTYRVSACNATDCTSPSVTITYVAAPYAINSFRPPVKGN